MQLEKLKNQVRFVQMIIKKELVVSGKKRAEIIRDLKSKGFKTFAKVAKANVQGDPEEPAEDVEEAEDTSDSPDNGYDYLLTVLPECFYANLSDANLLAHQRESGKVARATKQ
jgi:DNA topoisomerase II